MTGSQSALSSALGWLANNYTSWSPGFEEDMAPAAYALWLNDSTSQQSIVAFNYLVSGLSDNSTGPWQYGEADIPGEVLLFASITHNLETVNLPIVASSLLSLQQ